MNEKERRELQKQEGEILRRMREILPLASHSLSNDLYALEQKAHKDKNNKLLSLLKKLKEVQAKLSAL